MNKKREYPTAQVAPSSSNSAAFLFLVILSSIGVSPFLFLQVTEVGYSSVNIVHYWRKLALATHLPSRRLLNRSDFSSHPLRGKKNTWPFLFPPWPLGAFSSTVFSVLSFLQFTYATPKPWALLPTCNGSAAKVLVKERAREGEKKGGSDRRLRVRARAPVYCL